MSIPDTERMHEDVIDFMIEGAKKKQEVVGPDGKTEIQMVIDAKRIWLKTHNINSDHFGRFIFVLEELLNKAQDAFNHMPFERANTLANQILRRVDSYNYSIDAKSSETVRDKNNNQSNVLHILTHKTIEKKYNIKGEGKKTLVDGMLGREGSNQSE